MRTNRKRLFVYSFLLLFIMACRTYACGREDTTNFVEEEESVFGYDALNCYDFFEIEAGGVTKEGYTCDLLCPSGPTIPVDLYEPPKLSTIKISDLQAKYCPAPTEEPTEAPTEPPTDVAPPAEPPIDAAPLMPLLTGKFTTCDNVARYVNFSFAEGQTYDPVRVQVFFNGQQATCTPAASGQVLTCIYPPEPYGPPAAIQVLIDGQSVNEFNFDGGTICDPVVPQGPQGVQGAQGDAGVPGPTIDCTLEENKARFECITQDP